MSPESAHTGLPALPEGYFWRVYEGYGHHIVAIMAPVTRKVRFRRSKQFGVTEVDSHPAGDKNDPLSVSRIQDAAKYLLSQSRVQVKLGLAKPSTLGTDLYGDYPPKELP